MVDITIECPRSLYRDTNKRYVRQNTLLIILTKVYLVQIGIKNQISNQLYYQASNISIKPETITILAGSGILYQNSR
jgi:hypothetical protein